MVEKAPVNSVGQNLRQLRRQGNLLHFVVALCGQGLREGIVLFPALWRLAQHSHFFQSLHTLPICYWHPSTCCPGSESQSGWVCICSKSVWALQAKSPENLVVSAAALTPTDFYSQKFWGFIFLVLEPWAGQSGLVLGSLTPKASFLIFTHFM